MLKHNTHTPKHFACTRSSGVEIKWFLKVNTQQQRCKKNERKKNWKEYELQNIKAKKKKRKGS